LGREIPPADVRAFAGGIEARGYDELWVIEDCFWRSGVSNAALALGATERIHVGIGILPAVLRNRALAAMEHRHARGRVPGSRDRGLRPRRSVPAEGAVHPEQVEDAWVDELAVAGTPDDCRAAVERLGAAGTDVVVLVPQGDDAERQLGLVPPSLFR
jgi:alkanesulfonate monooxygenase SsuD/methylene tetrahydromethanopterin reductase-like flavin-dependent oxidoreductase (luciferase family)